MSNARRILVVVDDPAVRETVEQALSGHEHDVFTAPTGEDALWRLGRENYDLLVTGMVLRGINGQEVAEEVHARQMALPVIIINEETAAIAQKRTAVTGMAEILHQPLSAEILNDTVLRMLKAVDSTARSEAQTPLVEDSLAKESNSFVLRLRNVSLFVLGPLISLFYLLTFPIIGLGMLIHLAYEAKEKKAGKAKSPLPKPQAKSSIFKSAAIMLAMVFDGIAYAIFVPILGLGLIVWFGLQAWGKLGSRALGPGQA